MLSLQDVFSKEEVDDFVNSLRETLGEDTEFLVETKIDGLSMALRYENGDLVMAVTRGDGITEGEDVTMNARVIKDVVKKMPHPVEYIEIRGEVYMTRAAFEKVNAEAEEQGTKLFANPRNSVSRNVIMMQELSASWIPGSPRRGICPFSYSMSRKSGEPPSRPTTRAMNSSGRTALRSLTIIISAGPLRRSGRPFRR